MKKETGVLTAGFLGLIAVVGILALRKFLNNKEYKTYYNDFHRLFDENSKEEEHHGIEFLSMN